MQGDIFFQGGGSSPEEGALHGRHDLFQHMVPLRLDPLGIMDERGVLRQIEPGPLRLRQAFLHPDESPHNLPEIHLGQDVRGIDAHTKPRDIDAFAHHVHGDEPLLGLVMRKGLDRLRRRGIVRDGHMSPAARDAPHQLRHLPGMVLIHRDDEPSCIGLFLLAEPAQFIMRIRDDRPQPTVLQERSLEPFPLQLERESILEGRPMFAAFRQPGQLPS